jgi:hypothetical protein
LVDVCPYPELASARGSLEGRRREPGVSLSIHAHCPAAAETEELSDLVGIE